MDYYHVDVFANKPLSGNGLTVVFPEAELADQTLLEITREFKQFETIFIYPAEAGGPYPARIFTVDEELMFAGHPLIGAAAVIHNLFSPKDEEADICLKLGARSVPLTSRQAGRIYEVVMNQGPSVFINIIDDSCRTEIAAGLNLQAGDLAPEYPLEVISTGLPYLLVPVKIGRLDKCKIIRPDFELFLNGFGAKFVYVFDPVTLECRTWDNLGQVEDVATGSAAGPLCAYLVKNKVKGFGEPIEIHQGGFINRPSLIKGRVESDGGREEVFIAGEVSFFASGRINL